MLCSQFAQALKPAAQFSIPLFFPRLPVILHSPSKTCKTRLCHRVKTEKERTSEKKKQPNNQRNTKPYIQNPSGVRTITSVYTHQHMSCTDLKRALLGVYSHLPLIPPINLGRPGYYKSQCARQTKIPKCTTWDESPSPGSLFGGNNWTQMFI